MGVPLGANTDWKVGSKQASVFIKTAVYQEIIQLFKLSLIKSAVFSAALRPVDSIARNEKFAGDTTCTHSIRLPLCTVKHSIGSEQYCEFNGEIIHGSVIVKLFTRRDDGV